MTPRFHRSALTELDAAIRTGETRGTGLGAELVNEVERVVALLCDLPDIGERLDESRRRFPLKRFPYGIIYRVADGTLRVLAVAHRRQKPGYWRARE